MKRKISRLTMLIGVALLSFNCSSDDNNSTTLNSNEEKMIGSWEVVAYGDVVGNNETVSPINTNCYNTYTFSSDKTVNYKNYYPGDCSLDEENGIWNMEGLILTRTFPEDVELVMTDSIVFVSDTKIRVFQQGDNVSFTVYEKSN
ncbi:hypothetical protein FUA48_05875 [Flavobacterium alkalisoli]|uniref:Lipocalin-like domain-containing protein n=1 Tax=Flavobacterium alkalisoli TaxID=2602769 RepID=A0A5B9FQL5_9FLAO|nr:lipocalin family protein [Flavobacterium alkalisoli]QEE49125.1 hypothetical protein FUA48_05875 [Flavobacterium alkalisoli]